MMPEDIGCHYDYRHTGYHGGGFVVQFTYSLAEEKWEGGHPFPFCKLQSCVERVMRLNIDYILQEF